MRHYCHESVTTLNLILFLFYVNYYSFTVGVLGLQFSELYTRNSYDLRRSIEFDMFEQCIVSQRSIFFIVNSLFSNQI